MQKKLIALAVAGLMSGAAFAQTSVTIGGKFDAGYQFKRTAQADSATGGAQGGSTTETLGDGAASTSRITVVAKETISPSIEAGVNLDLRFGTIEEGKNSATTGGINSNDKKLAYLKTAAGQLAWGVINNADNGFVISSKPYMVEPKDLEIVKYGIATTRYTALTNRVTEYTTPVLNVGPFALLGRGQYAFGDNRKSGTSNVDGNSSGDAYSASAEWKFGAIVNGGLDYLRRTPTTSAASDSFALQRAYVNVFPVGGLKLAATYIGEQGYGLSDTTGAASATGTKTGFQDKITNYVVSYNFGNAEVGAEYSIVRDVGQYRNSGHGLMIGGAYFLSKSTYLYAAWQKNDWERNQSKVYGGKYDGTAAGFAGSADKLDSHYTRIGMVKEF